mgnify:CR=1 FL=1
MSERIGVMVCGHGSRDPEAVAEFESVWQGIHARLPGYDIESGFLEFAQPVLREGLDRLRRRGNDRVFAVPGMLFAAGHAKNDIPSVLNRYEAEHPEMPITYASELGVDPNLLAAAADRVSDAMGADDTREERHRTLLLFVGRGASDPDANANVVKVMRMLWEGMGFGWAEVAYSGVTFPLVEPALRHAARLGYDRIVVFPYFLFTGVLVRRIYGTVDAVAADHPKLDIRKAMYLRDHPRVLDAFAERVENARAGENAMNCKLCKYRTQLLGFEDQAGLPQESHHHHVEGVGTGDEHAHSHGHSHSHDHAHEHGHAHGSGHGHSHGHHHPYPHRDHPLGPASRKPATTS